VGGSSPPEYPPVRWHVFRLPVCTGPILRNHMRNWAKANKFEISQSRFTPNMFNRKTQTVYAEIKAKAHNCKVMLYWLAAIIVPANLEGDAERLITCMIWSLTEFCKIIDANKHWKVEEEVAVLLKRRGLNFLQAYRALSLKFMLRGSKLFAYKPKFHYFEHMIDRATQERLNFNIFWNFREEDLVGLSIDLSCKSHKTSVYERTLDRYLLRLYLALLGRDVAQTGEPPWVDEMIRNF
jgi:hypothetical protein